MDTDSLPNVSVIIPAYNAERTIKWCLQSLVDSDYPKENLEIIVVDNNSRDGTVSLAKSFPCKIIHEKTQGRSFARNTGAREAKGNFFAFIDADAYVDKNWIRSLVKTLAPKHIGGGQGKIIPSKGLGLKSLNHYRYQVIKEETKGDFSILKIKCFESPMINSAACMYKREAFENVNGFDVSLSRHEDIDLSKRVIFSGYNLAYDSLAEAYVLYHGESWGDYIERAFEDGRTKIDYLRKWTNSKGDSPENAPGPLRLALQGVVDNMNLFLTSLSWVWLVRIFIQTTQLLGRINGQNNELLSYNRSVTNPISLKIPKEFKEIIDKKWRFVFLDDAGLVVDIEKNKNWPIDYSTSRVIKMLLESGENIPGEMIGYFSDALRKGLQPSGDF